MKKSILNFSLLFIAFLSVNLTTGQSQNNIINQQKEADGYLVYFDTDVSQESIDSIMLRYNSTEIWITNYSKVRYWKVNGYPFMIDDSVTVSTIQELAEAWVDDGGDENDNNCASGVGSLSYNYTIKKEIQDLISESSQDYEIEQCSKFFVAKKKGDKNVIIDILDTGFDFLNQNAAFESVDIYGGYNFVSNSDIAQDDNGHGTHITSILSAMTTSANENAISIFESKTHDTEGVGRLSDIVQAIDHSIDIGANIINASWLFYAKESDKKTPVQVAIETAGDYGVLFVTAAGNDAIDNDNDTLKAYPASYPSWNILSVSSNACDSTLSYFSNYGFVNSDICAIGENVPGFVLNGQMALLSGTSQATAYVSSVAAILGTYLDYFDPKEVKQLILDGANFNDNLIGMVKTEGVVDLTASLALLDENDIQFRESIIENSQSSTSNLLKAYPSIFNEYLNIELSSSKHKNQKIELMDSRGEIVVKRDYDLGIGLNKLKMDGLANLAPGIYFLKTKLSIKKIIKTR